MPFGVGALDRTLDHTFMHTLIIQLGRLGDVIQTTPLLRDLAAAGDRIDLLLLHPNQAAILGLQGVATIYTLTEDLKPLDDQIAAGFTHRNIPPEAVRLLQELNLPRYHRVINASHAALGCWLAGQISCDDREGGVITPRGECLYEGAANTYRVAMTGFREQSWFNIVDLLRCAALDQGTKAARTPPQLQIEASRTHPPPQPSRLYTITSTQLPFALPIGRKIALNVGASEVGRRWPARHFARLAEQLSAQGFVPILVGAPSDHEACAEVQAASRTLLPNFAGTTSIPEIARLLVESELLVTADTGAAHIAAAVGTPVVGLYGSTAYFSETSPWGEGHLILQTPIGASMSALTPDVVLAAALNLLGRLDSVSLQRELDLHALAAWETRFLPANADPLGGLYYVPVPRRALTIEDLFTRGLRHVFAREFCGGCGSVSLDYLAEGHGPTRLYASDFATRVVREETELRRRAVSLARILEQMEKGALACTEMNARNGRESCSAIDAIATALTNGLEELMALATKTDWAMFRPVIHYLHWRLRMMPVLPPQETFKSHAKEYRTAANLLCEANALVCTFLEGNRDEIQPDAFVTTSATKYRYSSRIAV